MAILKLVRWSNLLYIFALMSLLRYCLVKPFYSFTAYQLSLNDGQFLLLCLSVVLIAAGGYIINDYYDRPTDTLNKPDKVWIGTDISPTFALQLYALCNVSGIGIAFWVANVVGVPKLAFIQVATAILLWFYTLYLQRLPLIGNILVALLCGAVVLIVAWYEKALLNSFLNDVLLLLGFSPTSITDLGLDVSEFSSYVLFYFYVFAFFAFLYTLLRELIKDIEDSEGDESMAYKTLPIVVGIPISKLVGAVIVAISLNYLAKIALAESSVGQFWSASLIVILAIVPSVYLLYNIWKARRTADFSRVSLLVKVIMFLTLLYLPYFRSTIKMGDMVVVDPNGETIANISLDSTKTATPDTLSAEPTASPNNNIDIHIDTAQTVSPTREP
ncbi:MAG: geranylgeranylglycerol-phosphate geranylgeranyltransferase [Chitinophagales bacterium]|nr:geranylgeranylglycerol-phosphate geranylgeranyltransferase [Chitinophagales bacterium]